MTQNQPPQHTSSERPTDSQRWSVLRIAAITIGMTLTVPVYYIIAVFVPSMTHFVPPIVVHGLMAFGLLVGFPATHVYARFLERRAVDQRGEVPPEYGVNDEWERRNL